MGALSVPVLAGVAAAVLAILGYASSIIPEFVAAGMGIGAFGALAYPILSKIVGGVSAIGKATTAVARDKAWDAIPKALQPAVKTVLELKAAWDKMSQSLTPLVGRIAETIGQIAGKLLPLLRPLAVEAGKAIEGLLRQFDKVAGSPGFKSFFAEMTKLSGPAITTIGQGLGKIAGSVAQFVKDLASPNGIITLKALFFVIAGAIRVLGVAFQWAGAYATGFANILLTSMKISVSAVKAAVDAILSTLSGLFHMLAQIPGPFQSTFRRLSDTIKGWQATTDSALNGAMSTLNRWSTNLKNAPKIVVLQANISDLQTKLAIARQNLNNPDLTKTRRAAIQANIAQLLGQIAIAKAQLAAINGTIAYTYIQAVSIGPQNQGLPTHGSGGITGAGMATGGIGPRPVVPRSRFSIVGERGREIMELPPGTNVRSNPDTERIMSQGAGGGQPASVVLQWMGSHADDDFMNFLIRNVRILGGDPRMFTKKVAFAP